MNKLTPDLYAEAFGILTRKLLKDDCLAMRNSILAKRPEKELDLYAEAFGILTRKLLKDDCLAMRNSILAKRPEKELITELFQPLLEMMEASESLTPNLSNPLYTQLTPPDEGNVPTFFIRDFFYIYYDIMFLLHLL